MYENQRTNPTRQHIKALLRKNWILFKRSCCCSCCEMLLPIIFAFLLLVIRSRISKTDIAETSYLPVGEIINNTETMDINFNKAVVALAPICLFTNELAANLQGKTKYFCIKKKYGKKLNIMLFFCFLNVFLCFLAMRMNYRFFSSDQEIDDYVRNRDYGTVSDRPYLSFGVSFSSYDNMDYEYSLRYNVSGNNPMIDTNNVATIEKYYP